MIHFALSSIVLITAPTATVDDTLAVTRASEADHWPQWRGPDRNSQAAGPTWPASLDEEHLSQTWRVEGLGPGYSGPIVVGDMVFIVETRDEEREIVHAYDRATGEERWATSWEGAMEVPFFAAKNGSWIRSTPACDGEHLFVAGMRDVLVAINITTGDVAWKVDFVERFGTPLPSFGFVCSPLIHGDHLFVQAAGALVKLDKSTGDTIWRSIEDGGGMNSAFSSPIIAMIGGTEQVIVQTRTELYGVDPDSGDELWTRPIRAFRGMNILTPTMYGDDVFISSYGGRSQLLSVSRAEDAWEVEQEWDNAAQGYMNSPVIIDDHVYFFTRSNRFACISMSDGASRWISGPTGDDYWSTIAQGDRILALNDSGILRLIRATPEEYVIVSERSVADAATWAHIAVSGNQVFVREQNALAVWTWE